VEPRIANPGQLVKGIATNVIDTPTILLFALDAFAALWQKPSVVMKMLGGVK
jgi:hypothetical protein